MFFISPPPPSCLYIPDFYFFLLLNDFQCERIFSFCFTCVPMHSVTESPSSLISSSARISIFCPIIRRRSCCFSNRLCIDFNLKIKQRKELISYQVIFIAVSMQAKLEMLGSSLNVTLSKSNKLTFCVNHFLQNCHFSYPLHPRTDSQYPISPVIYKAYLVLGL